MQTLPPLELLERSHDFPGPYMFKVIGKVEGGFLARIVASVREELGQAVDPPYSVRETAGGRHISITLSPTVASAAQVLGVYRRLQGTAGLVVLF